MLARWCEADRPTPPVHGETFREPADIAAYLGPETADLPQEQLRVVLLDRRGRLIDTPLVYQGGQSETAVRLADCFREAIRHNAAAIVLVHNHPSGAAEASPEDVQVTYDAGRAGLLLGVDVLDHVILASEGFASLRAEGLYIPPVAAAPTLPTADTPSVASWGYDCARCGARMRGLTASSLACQRCLAPVTSRLLSPAQELPVSVPKLSTPAAA